MGDQGGLEVMGKSPVLFVGRRSGKEGFWRSFENEENLSGVKHRIQRKCLPCIENLYRQLLEGRIEIEVGNAYDCWKVVVVLNSEDECEKVLEQYQRLFLPARHIQGRYGSHLREGTKAIIANAENEMERDLLLHEFRECIRESGLGENIFYTRACANLYGEILGDWHEWELVSTVREAKNIHAVMNRVRGYLGF